MEVELLVTSDCPHRVRAEALVALALDDVGLGSVVPVTSIIRTIEEANPRGFGGSPTILTNDVDPFGKGVGQPTLACRLYQGTAGGPSDVPPL